MQKKLVCIPLHYVIFTFLVSSIKFVVVFHENHFLKRTTHAHCTLSLLTATAYWTETGLVMGGDRQSFHDDAELQDSSHG